MNWANATYTDDSRSRQALLRLFVNQDQGYAATLTVDNMTSLFETVSNGYLAAEGQLRAGSYVPARRIAALIVRGYLENAGRIILNVVPGPETARLLAKAHRGLNAHSRFKSDKWPPICRDAYAVVLSDAAAESLTDNGDCNMRHLKLLVHPTDVCVDFSTDLRADLDAENVTCDALGNLIRTAWPKTTHVHFHRATGELPYTRLPIKHLVYYAPTSEPFSAATTTTALSRQAIVKEKLAAWNQANAAVVFKEVRRREWLNEPADDKGQAQRLQDRTINYTKPTAEWKVYYPKLSFAPRFGSALLTNVRHRMAGIERHFDRLRRDAPNVEDKYWIPPLQLTVPTTMGLTGAVELAWVTFKPMQGEATCPTCQTVCFDTAAMSA